VPTAAATTLAAVGTVALVKSSYEIVSGNEAFTGRELSDEERWESGGEMLGGAIGGGAAARVVPGVVQAAQIKMGKGDGGKAFDARVGNTLKETHTEVASQVHVKVQTAEGVPGKVVPDYIGKNTKTGKHEAIEAKSTNAAYEKAVAGKTAQAENYKALAESGGQVRSGNKRFYGKGDNLQPMPTRFVGPRQLYRMENGAGRRTGINSTGAAAPNAKPEKPREG
jgi:hypothetical protein